MYRKLFNFKGNINIVEQSATVTYKGKDVTFNMKKIMQTSNNIQLEVVELLESTGDHLYLDFISINSNRLIIKIDYTG